MKAAATVLVLVMLVGVASADRKVALKFFRAGEKAYQAQDFEAAAENFDSAYETLPLPEIAFSAAQAYRRQYRVDPKPEYVRRSVELYEAYLAKVKTGGRVGDAADSLEDMKRELDKLSGGTGKVSAPVVTERPTQLGVTVKLIGVAEDNSMREVSEAQAAGTAIAVRTFIDGKLIPADKMIDVEPADHVVRAEADGFAPFEKKEVMPKGRSELVELELQPLPARVKITTEAEARVIVDGRAIGTSPLGEVEIEAGRHVLTIMRRGRKPVSRELVVQRGQQVTIDQPLKPTLRRRSVKWVAIGGGVLALLTASSAAGAMYEDDRASDKLAKLREGNQDPAVLEDYRDARDIRNQAVGGVWIVGTATVAVGLTAAFLYYFDTPSAEGLRVEPIAAPGVGGAQVIGRF